MSIIILTGVKKTELTNKTLKFLKENFKEVVFSKDLQNLNIKSEEVSVIVCKFNKITKKDMLVYPNLKYILVFATGYSNVDLDFTKFREIQISNTPGYSTTSVSEFIFASLLDEIKCTSLAKSNVKKSNLDESIYHVTEIKNKTFGILGMGRIGTEVSRIALGFGAKPLHWSRRNENTAFSIYTELEELLSLADIVSINLPLNKETNGLLDSQKLGLLKPGAILINTSPLEIVKFNSLVNWLEKNSKSRYILDHSDELDHKQLNTLKRFSNCIIYPPVGYISQEAFIKKNSIFVENLKSFFLNEPVNLVNV